jgi:predicted amidohydrolase
MENNLKVAAIQFNITLGDIDRNLAKVEAALNRVASRGAQLAVLPELWRLRLQTLSQACSRNSAGDQNSLPADC